VSGSGISWTICKSAPRSRLMTTPTPHHSVFLSARRYVSAGTSCGPMSVCLSVTSRCSIEVVGRIELVFGMEASFDQFYAVFSGNSGMYKNKGTSLWNFFVNSGLKKISPRPIIDRRTCYQLSSRKVDAPRVINWAVVGQLSWQYLRAPTLDHYSLSHRSSSAVYSTIVSRGSVSDS